MFSESVVLYSIEELLMFLVGVDDEKFFFFPNGCTCSCWGSALVCCFDLVSVSFDVTREKKALEVSNYTHTHNKHSLPLYNLTPFPISDKTECISRSPSCSSQSSFISSSSFSSFSELSSFKSGEERDLFISIAEGVTYER